ncbi:hypothetical protein BDK51DRAFT_32839, partial [Blyttiomyces helicus]
QMQHLPLILLGDPKSKGDLKGGINLWVRPVCLEANPRFTEWIGRSQVLRTKPPDDKFVVVADFDDLGNPRDTSGVSNVAELEIETGSNAHNKLTNDDLFGECSLGELDATRAEIDISVKALMGSLQCGA